jgi:hypothetical protein
LVGIGIINWGEGDGESGAINGDGAEGGSGRGGGWLLLLLLLLLIFFSIGSREGVFWRV